MAKNGSGVYGNGPSGGHQGGANRRSGSRLRGFGGNRGSGGRPGGGGGGGGSGRQHVYDSNGPLGRVRGNANQVYERYAALARDAGMGNDRVLTESLLQHAEHYYRIMLADGYNPYAARDARASEELAASDMDQFPPLDPFDKIESSDQPPAAPAEAGGRSRRSASGRSRPSLMENDGESFLPAEPDMAEMMPSFLRPARSVSNQDEMSEHDLGWDEEANRGG